MGICFHKMAGQTGLAINTCHKVEPEIHQRCPPKLKEVSGVKEVRKTTEKNPKNRN